jgi:UDP-N-acetyl-2-amino-2-deoxyglucuronate dehydrogenase
MPGAPVYTVGVMGLGGIGLRYDLDAPAEEVLTHTRAALTHPRTRLIWGVDPDAGARAAFEQAAHAPAHATLEAAGERADIIVVAAPTGLHAPVGLAALAQRPRLLLMEKPLAASVAEGEALVAACRAAGTALVVNYIRGFDPGLVSVGEWVRSGELGTLVGGVAAYTKGLHVAGTHLIHLLTWWLGDPERVSAGAVRPGLGDGGPYADLSLGYGAGAVAAQALGEPGYSVMDVDLYFTHGHIGLRDGAFSVRVERPAPSERFPGFTELAETALPAPVEPHRYQYNVLDALVSALDGRCDISAEAARALSVLRTCARIAGE